MNKILKIVIYGVLVWLIPTAITALLTIFPNAAYLFDIISALTITISVALFSYLYFKNVSLNFIREGIVIGLTWLVISVVLDSVLIAFGITHVSFADYAVNVPPLYVIILAVTIGYGLYLDQNRNGRGLK